MGTFCLVLHTHLPYVRRNGTWPSGEDFYHQAALESYLPLLDVLQRLSEDGHREFLTLGLSPMIAHQMADAHMADQFDRYLGLLEMRAWQQTSTYEGAHEAEVKDLAAFYARAGRRASDLLDRTTGGLAAGFGDLGAAGAVEILGGPATHPYLPLVSEPALARAQVLAGAADHERLFGRRPAGMWLPECAYRPDASIEHTLDEAGVGHIVIDGPTMLRSAGPGTTFAPRRIEDSGVIAFPRNLDVTYRIWSPTGGYPTGKWYRDFFHYDIEAGFKNLRVTSIRKPGHEKRPYEPERAAEAARADAENFATLIVDTLAEHERETRREGLVVAAYDTELFGHWWYEGPTFLEHLFRTLRGSPVRAMSMSRARQVFADPEPVALVEGSWGFRKDHRSWVDEDTEWMWKHLTAVEAQTVEVLEGSAGTGPGREAARAHLLREAFLLQSSDWPFMVIRGRNPDYARERFEGHRARWNLALELIRSRIPDDLVARQVTGLFATDNILPGLDPAIVQPTGRS